MVAYYDQETADRFSNIERDTLRYWDSVNPNFRVSIFELENEGITFLCIEVFNENGDMISEQRYT